MNDEPPRSLGSTILFAVLALAVLLSVAGGVLIGYRYMTLPVVKEQPAS